MLSHKFWPYKLLVYLLYSEHDSIARHGPDLVVQTGPLAAHLGLRNGTLQQYAAELQEIGLADRLKFHHGSFRIVLKEPLQ